MAFIRKEWKIRGEIGATPINKANLNDLEGRIESAFNDLKINQLFVSGVSIKAGFVNYITGLFCEPTASGQVCGIINCKPNTTYVIKNWFFESSKTIASFSNFPMPNLKSNALSWVESNVTETEITTGPTDIYLCFALYNKDKDDNNRFLTIYEKS